MYLPSRIGLPSAHEMQVPRTGEKLVTCAPEPIRLNVFGRQAHASYLLGKVVGLRCDEELATTNSIENINQLDRTIESLTRLIETETHVYHQAYYSAAIGMAFRYHIVCLI